MPKKNNTNVNIYLRKENYSKYKAIADKTKQPISRVISQMLQEDTCLSILDELLKLIDEMSLLKKGGDNNATK